ncbi:MAG: serine--tRNA ligase [Erysipelotrichaceae bacterium]|jgi:seryl-tRNA synthetase|nr:serine--tRNA ligase [Bacilli bacterium]NLV29339.1 serine--tRNA ligase [Erysipelotrichaceae bacterium]HPY79738.1 serine--tRNA ligase [Bacilli bacterium]HQA55622.1 serine--tRNA ligase [Bacilli bacterium]
MLDINLIRENPEKVKSALKKKEWDVDFTQLLEWDTKKKSIIHLVEDNKAEINRLSASVPAAKKAGEDVNKIFVKAKKIAANNVQKEAELKELEDKIFDFMAALPNMPDEDLLGGGKEKNKVVHVIGEKSNFGFKFKDHVELATSLGLVDYDRASKISGRGTWIYTNLGARLEWALLNFFISEHLKDGYEFILLPHLLNEQSGFVAGQFPKFREDVFWLDGVEPKKFLLPTAETGLVNIHRDEILKEEDLPRKYFSYTPCYRREAGSYRTEERGMIRGYQFDKVEMVQYTKPEDSDKAFEELVNKAMSLVEKLGLHFRVSKLAAGDISHSMARTYDIEVYIPSIDIYKEVSSASNARDYQARRGMMRYRDKETGKTKYLHTLNASGLATSRIFPALLEQYQQEDGSVKIPEVLQPFMGGIKILKPIK